ncbi:MAG: hypothetical protein AAGH76_05535 [Pseudomonadota bacterium]
MTASQRSADTLGALSISGDDRVPFLQGQLSCDLRLLEHQAVLDGAWLNPSGRVITALQVISTGSAIGLFLPNELVDSVAERLTKFRFRARVDIDASVGWQAGFDIDRPFAERRLAGSDRPEAFGDQPPADPAAWRLARLRAGHAWIGLEATEQYTAHQLNLDRLGAISFDKGCYSGQEIVARTEHRGKVKRRLIHLVGANEAIEHGAAVTGADGAKLGTVVDAVASDSSAEVLALLPIEIAGELLCNGSELQRVP